VAVGSTRGKGASLWEVHTNQTRSLVTCNFGDMMMGWKLSWVHKGSSKQPLPSLPVSSAKVDCALEFPSRIQTGLHLTMGRGLS
jgi:hypothetical protein